MSRRNIEVTVTGGPSSAVPDRITKPRKPRPTPVPSKVEPEVTEVFETAEESE